MDKVNSFIRESVYLIIKLKDFRTKIEYCQSCGNINDLEFFIANTKRSLLEVCIKILVNDKITTIYNDSDSDDDLYKCKKMKNMGIILNQTTRTTEEPKLKTMATGRTLETSIKH